MFVSLSKFRFALQCFQFSVTYTRTRVTQLVVSQQIKYNIIIATMAEQQLWCFFIFNLYLSWHSRESREGFLAGRAGRERFFIGRISPEISKKLKYISYFPTKVMEYCTYWLVMYIYFKTIKIYKSLNYIFVCWIYIITAGDI